MRWSVPDGDFAVLDAVTEDGDEIVLVGPLGHVREGESTRPPLRRGRGARRDRPRSRGNPRLGAGDRARAGSPPPRSPGATSASCESCACSWTPTGRDARRASRASRLVRAGDKRGGYGSVTPTPHTSSDRPRSQPAAVAHHAPCAVGQIRLVGAGLRPQLFLQRRLDSLSRAGRDLGIGLASAARRSSSWRLASRNHEARPFDVASSGGSSSPRPSPNCSSSCASTLSACSRISGRSARNHDWRAARRWPASSFHQRQPAQPRTSRLRRRARARHRTGSRSRPHVAA